MSGIASIRIVPIHSKTTIQHSQAQNIIDLDNDGIDDRITGYKDENHNGTDDRFEPEEDIGE